MSYQDIVVTKEESVGVIRLNRPQVLNALSRNLYKEVNTALTDLEEDAEVKAIIFTGTGDNGTGAETCAGWTSDAPLDEGTTGRLHLTLLGDWTAAPEQRCDLQARIYCFQK